MNIAHRKFTDGFSWVTSAFKISLSNFLSYGLYCIIFLIIVVAIGAALLFGLVSATGGGLADPVTGIYRPSPYFQLGMSIIQIVVIFGMLIGTIKASLDMVNFDKVSLRNFFFGFTNPLILVKLILFTILFAIIGSIIIWNFISNMSTKPGFLSDFLEPSTFWTEIIIAMAVGCLLGTLISCFLTRLVQRDDHRLLASIADSVKAFCINILPFFAMMLLTGVITYVLSWPSKTMASFAISKISENGIDPLSIVTLLVAVIICIFEYLIPITAMCVACEDIFSEDRINEEEILHNSNSVIKQ